MEIRKRLEIGSPLGKFLMLVCIMIGMQSPLSSISGLLWERNARRETAKLEVSQMAGGSQRLQGPFVLATLTETILPDEELVPSPSAGGPSEATPGTHAPHAAETTPANAEQMGAVTRVPLGANDSGLPERCPTLCGLRF